MTKTADSDYKRMATAIYTEKSASSTADNDYYQEVVNNWEELSTMQTQKGLLISLGETGLPPKSQRRQIIENSYIALTKE